MKRARIGDVYYIKVPNGYKLYQWAYSIPRKGDYIRVFPGLYNYVPENISRIVAGPHSYIISFYSSRAYQLGLSKRIANYPVPLNYPFPDYMVSFIRDRDGKVWKIDVMPTDGTLDNWHVFEASHMHKLPEQFTNIKLLNHCITPNWLLFLFDSGFDLSKPEGFFPCLPGEKSADALKKYTDIVNSHYVEK